jgi:hypothetical protein
VQNLCYIFEVYDKETKAEERPFVHVAGKFDRNKVNGWMRDIELKRFETVTSDELQEVIRREEEDRKKLEQKAIEEKKQKEEAEVSQHNEP